MQKLGQTVDQISSFQLAADNKFLDMNDYLANLKELLSSRHQKINNIGDQLKARFDELSQILKYIRTRKATKDTYEKLDGYWEKYPDHLFSVKEIIECFRSSSSDYLNLSANVPMVSLYREALLFLERYDMAIERVKVLIEGYEIDSPEEDACIDHLKERIQLAPDFEKESNFLMLSIKRVEQRKEKLRVAGSELAKAEALFKSGRDLESKLDLDGAINFYNSALKLYSAYSEAKEALTSCQNKKKQLGNYQKANNFFACGNVDQAKALYEKVLKANPGFREARVMLVRIEDMG